VIHVFIAAIQKKENKGKFMPKGKDELYTRAEAASIVENEGLAYAVQHYIRADKFKDPELRRLWQAANDALDELEAYLNE
jgi:hypothetical protein